MAMKISNDLERIGDYATNIASRCKRLANVPPVKPLYTIPRMAQITQTMVKDILDAYVEHDTHKAIAVWHRDDEVDELFTSLFRELLTYVVLSVVSSAFSSMQSLAVAVVQRRVMFGVRTVMFESLIKQDIAFFDGAMTGPGGHSRFKEPGFVAAFQYFQPADFDRDVSKGRPTTDGLC